MKTTALPRAPFAVLAIAVVLLGMAGLMERVGLLLSAVVFLLGTASLPYAYSETARGAVIPFLVGSLLVIVGGVALATGAPWLYGLLTAVFGILTLTYGAAAELPGGRAGRWNRPTGRRTPA